jgi:hypothetical protein
MLSQKCAFYYSRTLNFAVLALVFSLFPLNQSSAEPAKSIIENQAANEKIPQSHAQGIPVIILEQPEKPESEILRDREFLIMSHEDLLAQKAMALASSETVWLTKLQILLSMLATAVLLYSLQLTRKATKLTEDMLVAAREATAADNRAWITVKLEVNSFEFQKNVGAFDVKVRVENIGKTPALHVHTHVDVVVDHDFVSISNDVRKLAALNRLKDRSSSRILAPNDFYLRPWGPTFEVNLEEFENRYSREFYPVIIGCVTYETQFGTELHQTAFAYVVTRDGIQGLLRSPKKTKNLKVEVTTGGFSD